MRKERLQKNPQLKATKCLVQSNKTAPLFVKQNTLENSQSHGVCYALSLVICLSTSMHMHNKLKSNYM